MYGPINSSGMALTINGMANARKGRIYHLLVIQSLAELRTAATLILQQIIDVSNWSYHPKCLALVGKKRGLKLKIQLSGHQGLF
jgi:hypothetical protein